MNGKQYSLDLQGKNITFEFANLAEQANGNVLVRIGDTIALITAVMSRAESANLDFFPLTVDYEEKFYAAGKILGSRFVRREGRPTDDAIITARLIDRAIRPLFPKGFKREVQVITTCLSWDAENDSDIIGLLGASVALSISPIPWQGPLGALRIGRVQGEFVLNPTYEQRRESDLDFVVAGIRKGDDVLLNMIEAESEETPEEVFEDALAFAKPYLMQIIEFQERLIEEFGIQKIAYQPKAPNEEMLEQVRSFLGTRLEEALFQGDKLLRMAAVDALKEEAKQHVQDKWPEDANGLSLFFEEEIDRLVHEAALQREQRVDDRKLDEIRPLAAQIALLPRTHGSGLFVRGQTKTFSILTLGAPGDQRLMEGMEFIGKKRFMHHYNFPPYAPGEVRQLRGPGRREIGHGMLAEKALFPVIPSIEEFPYTIRIVTEVVSSNGSTSMASACSSSLALMDAGVPISRPVAGISIGLMQGAEGNYALLTDIQGPEDHYGDMDFKIAGTKEGICAIQLDVKVQGISTAIFREALARAKKARYHIIDEIILKTIEKPRPELSRWAPSIEVLKINPEKIGLLIGPGGKMINKIIEEYGVEIDVEDTGEVFVTADARDSAKKAAEFIKELTHEIKVGEIFHGEVKRIVEFGAFVEIPGGQDGLLHISQLADRRVDKVSDMIKEGQIIPVKVIEMDEQGKIRLSLKEAQKELNNNK